MLTTCDWAQCNVMVVLNEILTERPLASPHTGAQIADRIILVLISILWAHTHTRWRSQHPGVTVDISNMSLLHWRHWVNATIGTSKSRRHHNEVLKRQMFNNRGHSFCPSQLEVFTNFMMSGGSRWLFLFEAFSASVQLPHVVPSVLFIIFNFKILKSLILDIL